MVFDPTISGVHNELSLVWWLRAPWSPSICSAVKQIIYKKQQGNEKQNATYPYLPVRKCEQNIIVYPTWLGVCKFTHFSKFEF